MLSRLPHTGIATFPKAPHVEDLTELDADVAVLGSGSRSVLAAIDDRWDAVVFIGGGSDERGASSLELRVPAINDFLDRVLGPVR